MDEINPYENQASDETFDPLPAVSTFGTLMPRHISAILDNMIAMVLSVLAAQQMPDSSPLLQIATMIVVFLGYFFIFELIISTTPGKLLNGLVVRDFDGGRSSTRQITIRTLFRILEVNPLFFGGLPAAARIVRSRDKQRFGDRIAGTVVVFRRQP